MAANESPALRDMGLVQIEELHKVRAELELRERQLADCTRAMLDAATKLLSDTRGDYNADWIREQVAEPLLIVRAGATKHTMEAVIYHERMYLLTPAQAQSLDTCLMNAAGGNAGPLPPFKFVLQAAECYPFDAARKL